MRGKVFGAMRVAVIGAGSAGLAALRQCTANLKLNNQSGKISEIVCYEKGDQIGGTWVYVEETGNDRYGLPIHSSMYKNLRTNLPKEVMGYPDFQIDLNTSRSYLTRTEILDFLKSYCDYFKLNSFIKLLHNVELIELTDSSSNESNKKWAINVTNLADGSTKTEFFDFIMVCNGHFSEPSLPSIEGHAKFQGKQLHSHDYRTPEVFENKKVIVVGAGRSGLDVALEISGKASKVILSHRRKDPLLTVFPENIVQLPDIVRINETEATFSDGHRENADAILYCTGYKFSYPFLSKSCGVNVDQNMVTPLWKHLVSIENPTLALVGVPFHVCAFSMFDLQVRFILKYWQGEKEFPSKDIMLAEEAAELERKTKEGRPKRYFHKLGTEQGEYYDDLADTAGLTHLPPVLSKLHTDSSKRFVDDLVNYRQDRYKKISDFEYVKL